MYDEETAAMINLYLQFSGRNNITAKEFIMFRKQVLKEAKVSGKPCHKNNEVTEKKGSGKEYNTKKTNTINNVHKADIEPEIITKNKTINESESLTTENILDMFRSVED